MEIVFVTNGCGFGHATRDMCLAERLRQIFPEAECKFISYGKGVDAYRKAGIPCVDLELEEESRGEKIQEKIKTVFMKRKPDLVLCDERPEVLPITKEKRIETWYVTNFLTYAQYEAIRYLCKGILYAELPDSLPLILRRSASIYAVGPMVRKREKTYEEESKGQQQKNRIDLWLGGSDKKMVVLENLWLLRQIKDQLQEWEVWIHGEEYERYFIHAKETEEHWRWESRKEIPACYGNDIHLIRGGIQTLWEIALQGKIAVAIPYSPKVNPMERKYVQQMENRRLVQGLTYQEIREGKLKDTLKEQIDRNKDEERRTIQKRAYQYVSQGDLPWKRFVDQILSQK